MKIFNLCIASLLAVGQGVNAECLERAPEKEILLSLEDCLFVKYAVPEKGIVCSNYERALRLSKKLEHAEMHKCAGGLLL